MNKSKIAKYDTYDSDFATKLIRKNIDTTNGLFKINIYYG